MVYAPQIGVLMIFLNITMPIRKAAASASNTDSGKETQQSN